jgi:hypothetical protein
MLKNWDNNKEDDKVSLGLTLLMKVVEILTSF